MFCPKCGRQLPDGAKFCSGCGNKLINESAENSEKEKEEVFVSSEVTPEIPADDPVKPKKKGSYKIIIGIVVAVVMIGTAALGAKAYFHKINKEASPLSVSAEALLATNNQSTVQSTEANSTGSAEVQLLSSGLSKGSTKTQNKGFSAGLSKGQSNKTSSTTSNKKQQSTTNKNNTASSSKKQTNNTASSSSKVVLKDNVYVYVSDDHYEVSTNLSGDNTIKIDANIGAGYYWPGMLAFSSSEKYIYYYTNVESFESYTLCRIEYDKLKENPDKIDQNVEIIADNCSRCSLQYLFMKDDTIIYCTESGNLYYYDGKKSICVAKGVKDYCTDEVDKIIYHTSKGWYGVSVDDIDKKIELVPSDGTFYGYTNSDFETILYTREEKNGTNLYSVGFSKGTKLLANSVSYIGGRFYTHDKDGNPMLYLTNVKSYKLSTDAQKDINLSDENIKLYFKDDAVYLSKGNTLSIASISDGTIGKFSVITDDAYVLQMVDSTLYYLSNTYEGSKSKSYYTCGDLYACDNGKSTLRAQDIQSTYINIYSDGVITANAGDKKHSRGELIMINSDGKETVLGSHTVRAEVRVDESTLLYTFYNSSGGADLYCYDGKEKKLLKNGVKLLIWSKNSIENHRIA